MKHELNSKKGIVVMLSTDVGILNEGSAVHERMRQYGSLFGELHIILFTKRTLDGRAIPQTLQIGQNVLVHATRSLSRWCYISDAKRAGKVVLERLARRTDLSHVVVSTQDPFETGVVGKYLVESFADRPANKPSLHVQVHTDFLSPFFCHPHLSFSGVLNRVRLHMAERVLLRADGIRVVSARIERSLITKYHISPSKIQVLPIYVDPVAWAMKKGNDAKVGGDHSADWLHLPHWEVVGLMACRLTKEKQVDVALRAFAKVLQIRPGAGLIIAGSGPERKHLERLAHLLGVEEHVLFVGWQKRLLPFFHSTDFLLSTSLYEGYGMTMVEAMLAGLPVVTTDAGVAGELVVDGVTGSVVPVVNSRESEAALVASFAKLIMDGDARVRMGRQAALAARKHSYPSREAYLKAYREGVLECLENKK